MEVTLRGLLEKEIDSLTEPETLTNVIEMFKVLFPTKSMEDALFGFVVGAIYARFLSIVQIANRRIPSEDETKEYIEMIERRTMQIKGTIKLATGK